MKKLMTIAVCLLVAALVQAAPVGWSIAGATAYASGGYDVFLVGANGVTSVDQITALLASDGVESLSSYVWATGTVNASGAATTLATASGKAITYKDGGSTADNTYSAFAVIWDSAKESASYTDVKSITLANNSSSKTFIFGNQSTTLAANKGPYGGNGGGGGGGSNVPEPTSGLLLLVGGAMLALRRKQK